MLRVDKVSQTKYNPESSDSSQKSKQQNVLKILPKILFFEIVSSCKNHGWK